MLRPSIILLFILLTSSCASVRVTTRGSVPVTTVNAEEQRTKTIHAILGTKKSWEEDLCDRAPLAEVSVQPNLLYSFCSVITLGIWNPVKVTYKCNETCDY